MCVCVFFVCKQKTAYEMRISDWSSDVCSSDLGPEIAVGRGLEYLAVLRRAEVVDRAFMHGRLRLVGANRLAADRIDIRLRWHPAGLVGFARRILAEVGLASCRERVCPYV